MPHSILILDDDSEFRALLHALLEPGGHRLVEARTLAEAEQALQDEAFDLAIVDELLPDGSGLDVVRWLRTWNTDTDLVFMAPFWRESEMLDPVLAQHPNNHVLRKPVLPGELRSRLHDTLEARLEQPLDPDQLLFADFRGVEDILDFLRDAYRERLDQRLEQLEQAITRARTEGLDEQGSYEVLLMAHKLHGTSGSFGFFEVSAAVGKLALLFEQLLTGAIEDYEAFWTRLEEAMFRATSGSVRPLTDHGAPAEGAVLGRLLVVDEDEDFLRTMVELGREKLVQVVTATRAGEAVVKAREHELDGIFIDIDLERPEGGFRLARRIRAQDVTATLPVVFLSPDDSNDKRIASAHAGGALFLAKPVSPARLMEAVQRLTALVHFEPARVMLLSEAAELSTELVELLEEDLTEVRVREEPEDLLTELAAFRPDVLVMDIALTGASGFDICRMLRLTLEWQDLPIVLRTEGDSADLRQAAFQAGADDFIGHDVLGTELSHRIRLRSQRYRRLQELNDRDMLTGRFRRVFAERLTARLSEARRLRSRLALALLEVDRFGQLNDAHGMLAGDQVLAALGRLLGRRFRLEDLRARWGGGEFVVAFAGAEASSAQNALVRLQEDFKNMKILTPEGIPLQATFSGGVAAFPEDGTTVEALVRSADEALRLARTEGIENVRVLRE